MCHYNNNNKNNLESCLATSFNNNMITAYVVPIMCDSSSFNNTFTVKTTEPNLKSCSTVTMYIIAFITCKETTGSNLEPIINYQETMGSKLFVTHEETIGSNKHDI